MKNDMNNKMTIYGIGLKLASYTLLFSFIIVLINDASKFDFRISIIPYSLLIIIGMILILIGISLLVVSILTINKSYNSNLLCVKGVYSICRHPLYSAWILFIIPGIVLFSNSWIMLTIPLFMYFIFKIMIKEEETSLQLKFGNHYTEYKNKVTLLFPMLWKYTAIKD